MSRHGRITASLLGPMTAERRSALTGQLSWSAIGIIGGSALMFALSVIGARLLGPHEYGRAALVLTLAQLVPLLAPLGLDIAASRVVPAEPDASVRADLIRTIVRLILIATLCVMVLTVLVRGPLAHAANIDRGSIVFAAILGAVLCFRTAGDRLLTGLQAFRAQALGRPWEGVVGLSLLIVLWAAGVHHTSRLLIDAWLAGAAVVSALFALRWIPAARSPRRSAAAHSKLREYGKISLLHAITPIGFVYGDKLLVHGFLGSSDLGIYNAYYTASYLAVGQLIAIATNVLFPLAAQTPDKAALRERLGRLTRLLGVPIFLLILLTTWLFLELFGHQFGIQFVRIVTVAAWCTVLTFNSLFQVLTATHSSASYLQNALLQGVRSALFVGAMVVLGVTHTLTLDTAFLMLLLVELVDSYNLRSIMRRTF